MGNLYVQVHFCTCVLQVSWQLVAGVNIPLVPRTVIPIDNSSCSSLPPPTTGKQPYYYSIPTHPAHTLSLSTDTSRDTLKIIL